MGKTVAQLVEEAKGRIRSAAPDEIADRVGSGELLVVDVREPDEFQDGHIPGAINIPRGWLEFKADPGCPVYDERLSTERTLLLYCTIGGRGALATAALQELGYADVVNLEGGIAGWREAGQPIEQPEGAATE